MQFIWFQFVPPAVLGNAVALGPIIDPLVAMVMSGHAPGDLELRSLNWRQQLSLSDFLYFPAC